MEAQNKYKNTGIPYQHYLDEVNNPILLFFLFSYLVKWLSVRL